MNSYEYAALPDTELAHYGYEVTEAEYALCEPEFRRFIFGMAGASYEAYPSLNVDGDILVYFSAPGERTWVRCFAAIIFHHTNSPIQELIVKREAPLWVIDLLEDWKGKCRVVADQWVNSRQGEKEFL